MIDINQLREDAEATKKRIKKKDPEFDIERLEELDARVRALKKEIEALRAQRNDLAKQGAQGITDELRRQSVELGHSLKQKERELKEVEALWSYVWLACPNIPLDDVPAGGKEKNKVIRHGGEKPHFPFDPQNHLVLNEGLGWLDFEAAASMSGAQFVLYRGEGVKLQYALAMLMLKNNVKHGFEPVMPPYLVREESMYNAGNLPKFGEDAYSIPEDKLYAIPTAEVPLTNMYVQHIFSHDQLPVCHCAWTSCFRREAGGYGAQERGLIRVHQFEKVELYSICEPDKSTDELDRMVACAEDLLRQLGLHYRVVLLAAEDTSFQSAKTFDIEVWLPGQGGYYELSSASNCTDFQARRAQIRYRAQPEAKPSLVHTLNASSLALPRLVIALMETYQQKDGTIKFPAILQNRIDELW